MRINWKNIYGILGVVFCIWVFRHLKPVAITWFEAAENNHEFFEKHPALPSLTLAMICATALAIYKIHSERKK